MADSTSAGRVPEQLAVARDELEVLEALATGVLSQIANLYSRPRTVGQLDHTELSLIEHRHGQLKAYEELADNCYGRTVVGAEVDEGSHAEKIEEGAGSCPAIPLGSRGWTGWVVGISHCERLWIATW